MALVPMLRRIAKLSLRLLAAMGLALLLYLLSAGIFGLWATTPDPVTCAESRPVYVTTNGLHLFLILPREHLDPAFREALDLPGSAKYVSFGWGERAFYLQTPTWRELKVGVAIKALFWPSASAMHVSFLDRVGEGATVPLCPSQLERLLAFIEASFARDDQGALVQIEDSGYTPRDVFYEARGSYSLFYTCNNWVNQALKRAGVRTARWSPFDGGVLRHLE